MSLFADRRAIKQIAINLLSNAVKFTGQGGHISVRARNVANAIVLTIEDNGVGIPKDKLGKLGRPFEQVQNQFTKSHAGSGLGLAISRSLAELHGGALKIKSTEGVGTIVSVRIPVRTDGQGGVRRGGCRATRLPALARGASLYQRSRWSPWRNLRRGISSLTTLPSSLRSSSANIFFCRDSISAAVSMPSPSMSKRSTIRLAMRSARIRSISAAISATVILPSSSLSASPIRDFIAAENSSKVTSPL